MSWADKYHREQAKERKRKEQIIHDGKVFYDVFIIAICRVWKDRTLRIKKEPDDFVAAVAGEMANLFGEPGNYEQIRLDETGIELEVV